MNGSLIPRTSAQNIVMETYRESKMSLYSFLTTLNKSLLTSPGTILRLIQEFNWSKNSFGEICVSLSVFTSAVALRSQRDNSLRRHTAGTAWV